MRSRRFEPDAIPAMSAVDDLRQFVSDRLTAAAEEIFQVFHKTIIQYEEEIGRQRRLLDITWKPELKLDRLGERARPAVPMAPSRGGSLFFLQ